jgi:hypothetical protein
MYKEGVNPFSAHRETTSLGFVDKKITSKFIVRNILIPYLSSFKNLKTLIPIFSYSMLMKFRFNFKFLLQKNSHDTKQESLQPPTIHNIKGHGNQKHYPGTKDLTFIRVIGIPASSHPSRVTYDPDVSLICRHGVIIAAGNY